MAAERQSVEKSAPVTPSERYLETLSRRTFLSLWGYPRIFRDQHSGKEICDLLVVFDDNVIIFSDKHSLYKDTGRSSLDWTRWYKKAISESARQIWGAERWIKENPHRLFLDQRCQKPFPLVIGSDVRFYRIAVAHGAEAYVRALGRTGLLIDPKIIGEAHAGDKSDPFKVGYVDPEAKRFVHAFDRTALAAVMQTVDTIQDFTNYLRDKEALISSGRLSWAASEHDLLAAYLGNPNEERSFKIPPTYKKTYVSAGNWEMFRGSPTRLIQQRADRISYFWDALIESYAKHVFAGTLHANTSSHNIADNEKVLRLLARETRTKRRELSKRLIEFVKKGEYAYRVVFSPDEAMPLPDLPPRTSPPSINNYSTAYVFAAPRTDSALPVDERMSLHIIALWGYCAALRERFPTMRDIIGILVEPNNLHLESMHLLYIDGRQWGSEQEQIARKFREELGFTANMKWRKSVVHNIPHISPVPKNPRNKPCICGSGIKYKKCCGAVQ